MHFLTKGVDRTIQILAFTPFQRINTHLEFLSKFFNTSLIHWFSIDPSLTEMRKQAIEAFLFESEISLKKAENLLEKIYDRNQKGQLRPFCIVLKQACEDYIKRKKQTQTRNKAIQSRSKT